MHYNDRVYGEVKITEPVALELIACPSMQRLKGIDQQGYFEPYFPGTSHNRFDHSVGVFLLLRKYGAPLEEQIAGLLHDVSHAAFSHCIDYVLRKEVGNAHLHQHQDDIHETFIQKSEIPAILEQHGLKAERIVNDKNFPLKEKPLPDLCADRIDYALRDAVVFGEISKNDAEKFLEQLTTVDHRWVFKDFPTAQGFAELFARLNRKYYKGLPTAIMFVTVGEYVRYALKKKYVTESDLYTTDDLLLAKIEPHLATDEKLSLLFERMNNKVGYSENRVDYDHHVLCKSRVIDPLCKHNAKLSRVSEIDHHWATVVQQEIKPKEYHIKFEQ